LQVYASLTAVPDTVTTTCHCLLGDLVVDVDADVGIGSQGAARLSIFSSKRLARPDKLFS
jgi:hypothetical protein